MIRSSRIALFIASLAIPVVAKAEQDRCAPFDKIKVGLAESADEHPAEAGRVGEGILVLFVSSARTYTLVVLDGDGLGCLVAMGSEWHALPTPKPAVMRP